MLEQWVEISLLKQIQGKWKAGRQAGQIYLCGLTAKWSCCSLYTSIKSIKKYMQTGSHVIQRTMTPKRLKSCSVVLAVVWLTTLTGGHVLIETPHSLPSHPVLWCFTMTTRLLRLVFSLVCPHVTGGTRVLEKVHPGYKKLQFQEPKSVVARGWTTPFSLISSVTHGQRFLML